MAEPADGATAVGSAVMGSSTVLARPVPWECPVCGSDMQDGGGAVDYIYEQKPEELLGSLLPRYVRLLVYRAILESVAAEHAARMTAMDSATTNAKEMISSLTLQMNRARQAAITKELSEIVSGAESLKG